MALSDAERSKLAKKCFVAAPACKTQKSTNGKLVIVANAGVGKKTNQVKRKRCARTPSKCNKKQCGSTGHARIPLADNDVESSDSDGEIKL